jgi:WD40 repeat protein/transcriptional regulator with XRE-family HTH domain
MTPELSFGGWLRRRRRLLDLTQEELADQVGCSPVTIRKLETEERRPSKQLADRLAQCLAIPPEEQAHFLTFARATPPNTLAEGATRTEHSGERGVTLPALPHPPSVDWGEAPDVSFFSGRAGEVAQLRQWLVDERCRLVTLLGMGGMGKTALATMVATQVEPAFTAVVWRSLRNAPPVEELLDQCIQVVSNDQLHSLPNSVDQQIALLLDYLRRQRCLLIFDNFETVLQAEQAGHYLAGYEGYGHLLQQMGEGRHQSCLLLTSREQPKELGPLASEHGPVRTLSLTSLSLADSRTLLQGRGLAGTETNWRALHTRYSGNPLALKVVSATIRELFAGDIGAFLREETILFGGIEDLLAQQVARLSPLEQAVMVWLAVAREPVEPDELRTHMVQPVTKLVLFQVLQALRQRSLVERVASGFTLQNVVLEYLTARLIEQVYAELARGELVLLPRHALLIAQAKSYVRESQRTLILTPIVNRLSEQLGKQRVSELLKALLTQLQHTPMGQLGYAGGNLLNLLVHLNSDLRGLDCSHLAVWQADLRGISLHDVNFSQADLTRSAFTDSFPALEAVAFSPDGERLAAGTVNGEIRLWQVPDGQPLLTCTGHTGLVRSVRFSPAGGLLVSGSFDQTVRLWDVQTGQCRQTLVGHTGSVWFACFNSAGTLVASGAEDQTVRLWDVGSGRCVSTLVGHTGWVSAVCFSPDGVLLASSSADRTVRLWDVHRAQCLNTLSGHAGTVQFVCFSPDGRMLASAGFDQTVRLWDVANGHCLRTLQGHTNEVRALCFSPDGRVLASAGFDQMVRLWDVPTGQCFQSWEGHTSAILALDFNASGSLLATSSYDQTIRLWEVSSGQCVHTLQGHTGWVKSISFSPKGDILTAGGLDGLIRWWAIPSGQQLHMSRGHSEWVLSVACSPDGRTLASGGSDQLIRLWDMQSGRCLHTFPGHSGWVFVVCFSPDGAVLASSGHDGTVRLWEVASRQYLHTLQQRTDEVRALCFSPDGTRIAAGDDNGHVYVLDRQRRESGQTLVGHSASVWSVGFSPDSRLLASGSTDTTIRVWDIASGHCLHTLHGHIGWVIAVCFSPDGRLLASGGHDGAVRLWDVQTGRCLQVLQGHTFWVMSLHFSADGHFLASGSADATVRIWDVQTWACLRILRSDRPYERMNITKVTGLTPAQVDTLKVLGAVEAPNKD